MKFLPELLAKNWQLKLSALAMAVLLWTVPEFGEEGSQVLEDVPVRVQLNDPQWALRQEPLPATIRVTLRGPTRDLFALGLDQPSLVIPVNQITSPDTAILLRSPWLRMSAGEEVVVEELNPSVVNLSFEPMAVGVAALEIRLEGALPEGLSLVRPPEVTPALTRVSGPSSRIETLEGLPLLPLDLSRIQASGSYKVSVDTLGLAGLAFSPQEAVVNLSVEETGEREFSSLPLDLPVLSEDPQLVTRPATASVFVRGARSVVEGMDPSAIRIFLARGAAAALSPGEEIRATLTVEGVPEVVEARVDPEWVLLRRPAGT